MTQLLVDTAFAEEDRQSGSVFLSVAAYGKGELRERSAQSNVSQTLFDVRLGYATYDHVYLGASCDLDSEVVKTSDYASEADNKQTKYDRRSCGPMVGLISQYFFLLYTAHVVSAWEIETKTTSSTNKDIYKGGGSQIDLGFHLPVGPLWIGPQVSYKTFVYNKVTSTTETTESSVNPKLSINKLEPLLTVWVHF